MQVPNVIANNGNQSAWRGFLLAVCWILHASHLVAQPSNQLHDSHDSQVSYDSQDTQDSHDSIASVRDVRPVNDWSGDDTDRNPPDAIREGMADVVPAMWQPTPLLEPRLVSPESSRADRSWDPARVLAPLATANSNTPSVSGSLTSSGLSVFAPRDRVLGAEAMPKATTDLGQLLQKSSSAPAVQVQAKTPIVHDPRIRGSRVGSLAAAGSHWVPARADLDTIVSKFDSRQVASAVVTAGPYTSLLGPGFEFIDVTLLQSPRYADGLQWHGRTDADYRANGQQYLGQQSILVGAENWGSRFNYVHRGGDDYLDGAQTLIPAGYHSQEMTWAFGRDWENDSIEVNLLRLDQKDVIFPGYVFDMDDLVTDGYEVTHTRRGFGFFDAVMTEAWYNRTRFNGDAQNPQKRPFFPVLDAIAYFGTTDVDSMSTGYRQAFILGGGSSDLYKLSLGHDLRFIKQELNEISNSVTLGFPFFIAGRNSPIPESTLVNPGVFAEYEEQLSERTQARLGGRVDYASSDITDDPAKLAVVGLDLFPTTYSEVVGTNQFAQNFQLFSSFVMLTQQVGQSSTVNAGIGYAERAPTLTELYAAQPFLLLLQNGLNNVTGDPTLDKEKRLQVDLGYEFSEDLFKWGVRGYHAWAFDYITFENTQTLLLPGDGDASQVSLRYVNTDLATLAGLESFTELFPKSEWTPFASVRFVEATDRTRQGNFATTNGSQGNASRKDFTQVRGAASGVTGGASEALPGIPPLESRLGIRFHDVSPAQRWNFEMSGRLVARQDRVAASLLETPTPGFGVWDLRSVIRPLVNRDWVVAMGVENMFDRRYREHFDFRTPTGLSVNQPGANFYISSSVQY